MLRPNGSVYWVESEIITRGQRKALYVCRKLHTPSAPRDGRSSGRTTRRKVPNSLLPSIRADSSNSSGIAWTINCCIMNMPKAGATHGTVRANHGLASPLLTTSTNSGIRITANGIDSELNMTVNKIRLPRKRNFANPYPAIAHTNTETVVAMAAVPILIANQDQNGWVVSRFR